MKLTCTHHKDFEREYEILECEQTCNEINCVR